MFLDITTPKYPLRAFVRSMIYYKDYTAECNYEMLLPDGSSQLIISLDEDERFLESIASSAHTGKSFKNFWITGIQTKPVIYVAEKSATTLCIQFENGGLNALFGIPANHFKDDMVDASLVMSDEIGILREKLLSCTDHLQVMRVTETFLGKQLLNKEQDQAFLSFVIQCLCTQNQPLFEVVRQTGYSQKHLIHKFKTQVGVTPKKYQKLFRFNKALSLMQQEIVDYSEIAFSCNYFDQAHFINDFNQMSTKSPSQYLRTKRDYPHVLPLNAVR